MRAVKMDNLRGLLGVRRTDIVPNTRIRQFCGVTKGVDEERPRKIGIDTVKERLKKRDLNVTQARRMVHDGSVCRGFVRENSWGVARGINP